VAKNGGNFMNYRELLINKDKVVMTSVELAVVIGDCEEAIVLNQISYWIEKYKETGHNFIDGRYWVYNSYQKWHENNFPFWHTSKIQRVFKALENKGLLLSANYNGAGFDKTKWYSIDYDRLQELADMKEQALTDNEQSLIAGGQSLPAGEQSLIAGGQSLPAGEQSLIAGEYPIPEDTTENTTEDTTEDTCRDKYILSGKPDDAPVSLPECTSKKTNKKKSKTHPEEVRQIVEYFNHVCGTNYKYQSKATAEMINARLNDGFTVEDFRKVIDKKHAEWSNDNYWCKFLRPETLFRPSHFESYLNQRNTPADENTNGITQKMSELYDAFTIG